MRADQVVNEEGTTIHHGLPNAGFLFRFLATTDSSRSTQHFSSKRPIDYFGILTRLEPTCPLSPLAGHHAAGLGAQFPAGPS